MRIDVHEVSKGRRGQALPETSLAYLSGSARLAVAETEQRPTVLGLIASGRMRPDTGSVTIDGEADTASLRRRVALVDAPDVSDPAPNVTVATVVSEELMFAGRPANPLATRAWLHEHDLGGQARVPIADIRPVDRLRLLLELTVLRRDVEGLVLVSPDRHGGDPLAWWPLVEEFAERGLAVLVIAGEASDAVLAGRAVRASVPMPMPMPNMVAAPTSDADPDTAAESDAVDPVDAAGEAVSSGSATDPGGAAADTVTEADAAPADSVAEADAAASDTVTPPDASASVVAKEPL
ncbi:hypothetical protein [Microbacterium sp. 18062]|uniref:hypothetical protein n=1 Tax=Microbacterium sp. 18062 TaxID=2681410 RepID=UPI00190F277D|nr:hypothetical protein [Microbacterium sp. 18062]